MDTLLSKDELAVMKWIYGRAKGFGKDNEFFSEALLKETGLSQERYDRACSYLHELSLVGTTKQTDSASKVLDLIYLTAAGAKAYRHAVKQEEWDIVPERFQKKDGPAT